MNEKLKVLDLFSGIGGFSLGLERTGGFETVAFCEIEDYPRQILAKHWPDIPCFRDVRELTADAVGPVDIIVGGYPCQPFSCAGKRGGTEDDRHLWPQVRRLVAALRPAWCLFENVTGHVTLGLDQVLSDLEGEGYAAWPLVIPACAVDAPHRRDRVWILANARYRSGRNIGPHQERKNPQKKWATDTGATGGSGQQQEALADTESNRSSGLSERETKEHTGFVGSGKHVADANYARRQKQRTTQPVREKQPAAERGCRWPPESGICRVVNGLPHRVDRLKALGNAVVPQVVEMIGRAILVAEGVRSQ